MSRFKARKQICPECEASFRISGRSGRRDCPECGYTVRWGPRY